MRWRSFENASCIVGGLLLCSYAAAQLWIAGDAASALREFREESASVRRLSAAQPPLDIEPQAGAMRGQILRFQLPDTSHWSAGRVAAHRAAPAGELPSAILLIPSVGLEVPVYDGATELNLNRGAARIAGTAQFTGEGNLGLAAHRDGYFRSLRNVRKGDRVVVLTLHTRLQYRVTSIEVVEPDAVEVLAPTDRPVLTLVTCYPFYVVGPAPRRFIVRAEALQGMRESS